MYSDRDIAAIADIVAQVVVSRYNLLEKEKTTIAGIIKEEAQTWHRVEKVD